MAVSPETEALLRRTYAAFNRKDVDAVLATMHTDVDWPNMIEGARAIGHDDVRAYWLHQFEVINPHVEPLSFTEEGGRIAVEVHQVVRDATTGHPLSDRLVYHVYEFRDGLITAMDVRDADGTLMSAARAP
jgi:ketosteroid isomerase-like protein